MSKVLLKGDFLREDFLLMIPGPTFVHPKVLRALSTPMVPHRGKEFSEMFLEQGERMKKIFKTKNDLFIISGSGTSGMDAAVSSILTPKDKVLCLVFGKFSERFAEIVSSYGGKPDVLEFEWGKSVDVSLLKHVLEEKDYKAVTIVHNESSTGVRVPVKKIGEVLKNTETLLIVDTISSMGGDDIQVDKWGIDLCVSGSQKCLALPPGLSFVSVSEKAFENMNGKSYYLNLKNYKKHKHNAPFTQSVSLVYALKVGLDLIFEEGLEKRIERHRKLAEMTRKRIKEMGFELFPESEKICSQTVTAFRCEKAEEVRKRMMEHGVVIAGGQAHLRNKILRIGHMGNCQEWHVVATLEILEKVFKGDI